MRYVHEVSYKVECLMSSEEGIEEYKSCSKTVEAHAKIKKIYTSIKTNIKKFVSHPQK